MGSTEEDDDDDSTGEGEGEGDWRGHKCSGREGAVAKAGSRL